MQRWRREENSPEQEIGKEQGPDHVGGLGDEKGGGGPPTLHAHQLAKARLKADANEGKTEPDDPKSR